MSLLPRKQLLLAILTGVLLWVAFPGGGGLWPLVFVALVPLFLAISNSSLKNCFLSGLFCGLTHYSLLLYWIVIVLGKYGGMPWFISWQGLILLALYMSFYLMAFTVGVRLFLMNLPAWLNVWVIPAYWVGLDWLRGLFQTGLPWMDLGYSLYEVPLLIQVADLLGHHGVSFIIVLSNSILFFLMSKPFSLGRFMQLLPGFLFLVAVSFYSVDRYNSLNRALADASDKSVLVAVVQGNIDQSEKWSEELQEKTVFTYINMTQPLLEGEKPDFTVWPETALPFYPPASKLMGPLFSFSRENETAILTGAPWYEIVDRKARKIDFFNSAVLLGEDGNYHGKYYKTHLVPFGEYVPFKRFLPFLEPFVEAVGDFSPGKIESPLQRAGARTGVLICFESVFPDLSRKWVDAGANLLVNLTNDAWYGKSSAPVQSLAMTVLRAVETRRSIVRSANTGISAFISPLGRVDLQSDLFVPWAEKADVALLEEWTYYVRYGYHFAPFCMGVALLGLMLAAALARRKLQEQQPN